MEDENSQRESETDDLTEEMISSSKRKLRINALSLAAVLVLVTVAPQPWGMLAPLLFLLPLLHKILEKMRRKASGRGGTWKPEGIGTMPTAPYTSIPRDRSDPRRYRPIE